ncbi:hypothetical protein H8356DRAFT_1418765 [Neocallimastix lanati (nom. inval.)]|nr:hypothetical protein H8356DRAFT_1418765 [Neocallimastix sp. JGI-2020a]
MLIHKLTLHSTKLFNDCVMISVCSCGLPYPTSPNLVASTTTKWYDMGAPYVNILIQPHYKVCLVLDVSCGWDNMKYLSRFQKALYLKKVMKCKEEIFKNSDDNKEYKEEEEEDNICVSILFYVITQSGWR